jgi:hypothetical protein
MPQSSLRDARANISFEKYTENDELLAVLTRPMSLLERQGILVYSVGAGLYIILQCGTLYTNHHTEFAFCSPFEQPEWFKWFFTLCSIVLANNAAFQVLRILKEVSCLKPVNHSLVRVFVSICIITSMVCHMSYGIWHMLLHNQNIAPFILSMSICL